MRDYLSNEIIFNTPVLNKNLYDFISKDSPALRVGSRRIWKTIRIGAYHFCLYACPASKRCQRVRWKTIRTRAYHSWDAKFCDSPPVMRDYLSNEIIFNTPVLNKNLYDFISKDSPALRVGSRRIWKTIRIGAYHFCLYACPASKRCQRVRWKTIRTRAYHSWMGVIISKWERFSVSLSDFQW